MSKIKVRQANKNDNLDKIAELLYETDPYIYPYWFETLDKCKKELTPLLLEDKFFFNINNLYIALLEKEIVGVVCILDKSVPLDYDYDKLKAKNERYAFTIKNYIEGLIKEVKEADFVYISNVCVDKNYRGRHVGKAMLDGVIKIYNKKLYNHFVLDVLADNAGAIKLYNNLGFEQFSDIFNGFSGNTKKPKVFSMENNHDN